jgi:hypothetical protein
MPSGRLTDEGLANGWFRPVLVLDAAPDDLIRLPGYLGQITNDHILVDLETFDATTDSAAFPSIESHGPMGSSAPGPH